MPIGDPLDVLQFMEKNHRPTTANAEPFQPNCAEISYRTLNLRGPVCCDADDLETYNNRKLEWSFELGGRCTRAWRIHAIRDK